MDRTPGHRALRRGRTSAQGRIYHVTFATLDRAPWFREPALAAACCRTFAPSTAACAATLLCWVLMPDHFHGLLQLHGTDGLSRCVQRLKGRASGACRLILPALPAVWARGFYDHALRRDEDVPAAARYIVANPVRAGLVARVADYPYWNATWL